MRRAVRLRIHRGNTLCVGERVMELTLVAEETEVVRVRCEGDVRDIRFEIKADPLEKLLGPGCFTRKVLMDLEQTDFIDSGGVSWLIVTHKHFNQGGGCIV